MSSSINKSRRRLLGKLGALPLAASGVSMLDMPFARDANAMGTCTPRSLVCIFLAGGADSFNTFVPGGSSYNDYRAARNDLAVAENDLISVNDSAQGSFGFNKLTGSLARLYNENRLAVVSNVGPLIRPTTQNDYLSKTSIPQSLFAHDTQQKLWQTGAGIISGADSLGWGGAICDHASTCNGDIPVSPGFSMSGNNSWQNSINSRYTSLNPAIDFERMLGLNGQSFWIPGDRKQKLDATFRQLSANGLSSNSTLHRELAGAFDRATEATEALFDAFLNNPLPQMTYSGSNELASQLHLVARLIAARDQLGMQQQVFFVRMGGWDTHSNQNERLPVLMGHLNEAVDTFQNTLDDIRANDSVTTFTASDFGRTLTSNGNGTDHGWGGHNFVFGDQVQGGQIFGQMPSYRTTANPDDAGDDENNFAGRIIPKTSVNQYGATLARWMGVPDSEMLSVFPDLANFSVQDLGFMA